MSAEFDAMFREMVKDVRQTFNEVMLGHHEHAPEMGTPMNPTPQLVTREIDGVGYDDLKQHIAAMAPQVEAPEQGLER